MMKKHQEKKSEWKAAGHGEYSEIPEEKEFFNVTKGSDMCVIHFYREETFRCKIFDKHFNLLAKKHLETKFCKIDAEKCPFLCDRLKIRVIPSVLCIKNQQTTAHIMGFAELGNTDEFTTEMLEWRLAHVSIIIECCVTTLTAMFLLSGRGPQLQRRPQHPSRPGREEEEDQLHRKEESDGEEKQNQ